MKNKSKGFSLLEVALILLIMGFIGVAAIPSMQNIRRQEVNKLVKEICLDLVTQRQNQHVNSDDIYQFKLVNNDANAIAPFYGYQIFKDGVTEPVEQNINNNRNIEITVVDANALITPNIMLGVVDTPTSFTDVSKAMPQVSDEQLNALIDGLPYIASLKFEDGKMKNLLSNEYTALGIRVRNGSSQVFVVFNYITGNYYTYKN